MSLPFHIDLERQTIDNEDYRKVLYTDPNLQLVLMSLEPKQEIGMEVHQRVTQFIKVEDGYGLFEIGRGKHSLNQGESIVIPAGNWHNIRNLSTTNRLKLYTIYSPPEHAPGLVQRYKP